MHQYLMAVHHDDTNAIPEGVDIQVVFAAVDRGATSRSSPTGPTSRRVSISAASG